MPYVCAVFGCKNRTNKESKKRFCRGPTIIFNNGERVEELPTKRRSKFVKGIYFN